VERVISYKDGSPSTWDPCRIFTVKKPKKLFFTPSAGPQLMSGTKEPRGEPSPASSMGSARFMAPSRELLGGRAMQGHRTLSPREARRENLGKTSGFWHG